MIDFFRQRTIDIRLKGIAEIGRAEKSVDSNEQLPDVSSIVLGERADGYLCVHNLIPGGDFPRIVLANVLVSVR